MPTPWLRPCNPQPVRAVLAERGLTQAELCRRYGLEKTNLSKIVNGRLTVSAPFAEALTDATGLPIDALFEPELYMRTHWYARKLREERETQGGGSDA